MINYQVPMGRVMCEPGGVKRGRRVASIVAVGAVVLGLAAVVWPREREPEYWERTLGEWVIIISSPDAERDEKARAEIAISAIGTNRIPWMLRLLSYEPSPWRKKLDQVYRNLP